MSDPSPFALRGLKGLWWEPEQYLGWPSFLAGAGYDFFMLCYTFCPETGLRWRQPFRDAEVQVIGQLGEACRAHGITLCLALHPLIGGQAWAPEGAGVRFHPTSGRGWFSRYWQARRPGQSIQADPPIRYGSDEDLALLVEKARQAQALGVRSIALCLDDVDPGAAPAGFSSLASAHVWLANGLRVALTVPQLSEQPEPGGGLPPSRAREGGAGGRGDQGAPWWDGEGLSLLVVPTYYWTDGARARREYTATLADGLPPDVPIFWTGEVVRDHAITAEKAREAARLLGRKPLVWLNYASNDSFRFTLQLPPDRPPAPDLGPETAGLLLNSARQVGLARLDALVIGAYLTDPAGYDHGRAVGQAALDLVGETAAPWLLEIVNAWQAVPDVRALSADLQAGGRPFLDRLRAQLRPALATLDRAMPALDAGLTDRRLWAELAAGVERLRLLADALGVLSSELAAAGSQELRPMTDSNAEVPPTSARSTLLERLATVDAEAACDAEAVLMLGPV